MRQTVIDNQNCNIGWICTELQCRTGLTDKPAMRWISPHMERRDYTFG